MASYQDIDGRLQVIEEKVAFIMKIARAQVGVGNPLSLEPPKVLSLTFADLYQQLRLSGGELVDKQDEQAPIEGELLDN